MESLVHILLSNALTAAVMAIVVLAVGRISRPPALTHSLWLVVMLKLVTPPLVPVPLPVANIFSAIGSSPAVAHVDHGAIVAAQFESLVECDEYEDTARPSDDLFVRAQSGPAKSESDFSGTAVNQQSSDVQHKGTQTASGPPSGWRWEPLVLVAVLAGALGWWTLAAVRIIRFQRLLNDVQPAPEEWQSHTDELADQMGLGWCPSVCLVPGRLPPMLWAIGGRPRLLVPSQLWTEMEADGRTSLLLHELAHLKRRDHWVRWLELVVAGLYWWHPVVWWARRALREAEEQCCDAWVVSAMPDRARTYAAALLAAVEFVSGARPVPAAASATSGSGHVSCLKRRLKMIVRARTPKALSWAGRIAVLAVAALLLPLSPSWAQNNKLTPTEPDRQTTVEESESLTELQPGQHVDQRASKAVEDRIAEELRKDPEMVALTREIDTAREHVYHNRGANRSAMQSLDEKLLKLQAAIEAKKGLLKDLVKKGKVTASRPQEVVNSKDRVQKAKSEDNAQSMMAGMVRTDLALIEAQSMLDVKREAYKAKLEKSKESGQQVDAQQLARIQDVFRKDTDVLALKKEIDDTREILERIKRNLLLPHDPARVAAQNRFDDLKQEYNDLWKSKYSEILDRLTDPISNTQTLASIHELEQRVDVLKKIKDKQAELFKAMQVDQKVSDDDTFEATYLNLQLNSLLEREDELKKIREQLEFEASQDKDHVALVDPARPATEKRLSTLRDQYESLRKKKHDQLLALSTKDDVKKNGDDDKEDKARDVAERFQEQLQELISKLGKELSPVTEEVRKALERAVGEVHQSLEKDGLSAEGLGKALEKSQEELRKAFEGGGAVDKELREAIDRARKDMQDAFDRTKGDVQDQVESLRQQSRSLRDQARENFDRARSEAERHVGRDGEGQPNRDELESARKEIRELREQLRTATRRLDELQQRDSRRSPVRRREPNPQPEPQPQSRATPRAEPVPSEAPKEPAVPATPARPARPNARRPLPPVRPTPGAGRRGPQIESDKRLHELEEKIDQLLKELKSLKVEKSPNESK